MTTRTNPALEAHPAPRGRRRRSPAAYARAASALGAASPGAAGSEAGAAVLAAARDRAVAVLPGGAPPEPPRERAAVAPPVPLEAGAVKLTLPAGWRELSVPVAIPGLGLRDGRAAAPETGGAVLAGLASPAAHTPTLLRGRVARRARPARRGRSGARCGAARWTRRLPLRGPAPARAAAGGDGVRRADHGRRGDRRLRRAARACGLREGRRQPAGRFGEGLPARTRPRARQRRRTHPRAARARRAHARRRPAGRSTERAGKPPPRGGSPPPIAPPVRRSRACGRARPTSVRSTPSCARRAPRAAPTPTSPRPRATAAPSATAPPPPRPARRSGAWMRRSTPSQPPTTKT